MNLLRKLSVITAGFLLLASALPSRGNVIGTSTANLDGSYTYFYVVDNTAGAFDISSWSLDFAFAAPDWNQADVGSGGSVAVASVDWLAGPGIPVVGLSAQDFLSLGPWSDVLIGTSVDGFSFTSWFAPGSVTFSEFDAFGESSNQGKTVGPSARIDTVPEGGGSYSLLAAAFLAGCAYARRRVARPLAA